MRFDPNYLRVAADALEENGFTDLAERNRREADFIESGELFVWEVNFSREKLEWKIVELVKYFERRRWPVIHPECDKVDLFGTHSMFGYGKLSFLTHGQTREEMQQAVIDSKQSFYVPDWDFWLGLQNFELWTAEKVRENLKSATFADLDG